MGARQADYVRARTAIGVRREAVFLESTSMGDAIVVYWLADDPIATLEQLAVSSDPFDRWLRREIEQLHPIPLEAIVTIASRNTLIAQYPKP
jgi:alpha-beta hydrolase superfamily lysophospholipase